MTAEIFPKEKTIFGLGNEEPYIHITVVHDFGGASISRL
jgi:hypothetical protein